MQAFLLACYLCLQLTNLSENLPQDVSLKKDESCNQCLTGLFDQSELLNRPMTSNPALMEALEERLMLELSQTALKTRSLQKEESNQGTLIEIEVKKAHQILTTTESTLRVMQENMMEKMIRKSEGLMLHLQQQYTQLSRELYMLAAQQKEALTKEKEDNMINKDNVKQGSKTLKPKRNILNYNIKLLPGEQLVSDNGRYRAMLKWNGELVIIDHQKNSVVKKVGISDNHTARFDYLMLKPEGNLVIKSSHNSVADWTTKAYPDSALYSHILKLENDGQLVVYDALNRRIWTSGFV